MFDILRQKLPVSCHYLLSRKKAISIISFSEAKSHSAPLFKSLVLLNLDDIIKLQTLSFVYQWSHRLLPSCFNEYFKFTSPVRSYSTRQSCDGNLYLDSVNTTHYSVRSLKFTGSRLWISLPIVLLSQILFHYFTAPLRTLSFTVIFLNYLCVALHMKKYFLSKRQHFLLMLCCKCILLGSSTRLASAIWMTPTHTLPI